MGVEIENSTHQPSIQKEINLQTLTLQEKSINMEIRALRSDNFIPPIKKTINSHIWNNIKKRLGNNISPPQTISQKISFIKKKYINQEYYRTLVAIQLLIKDGNNISDDEDLQLIYIESLYKAKKYNLALAVIDKYSMDTKSDLALLIKARIFKSINNKDKALQAYNRLDKLFPNSNYSSYIKTELKLMVKNED